MIIFRFVVPTLFMLIGIMLALKGIEHGYQEEGGEEEGGQEEGRSPQVTGQKVNSG